ncbi:MAG: AAA family ATPase [Deferribacterales bacterium]
MYIDFFGFRDKPFRLTPEPSAFFCSAPHDRAMTMLEYGINSRKGFMLLYGLPGTGRTTLCFLLRETLVNCNVSYVPKTPDAELLQKICNGFGIEAVHKSTENEYFGAMMDYFVGEYKKGRNNLIIVDDADEYSIDAFRTLEKLSEVEIEQCKLVQVLLVGTQELCSKLMYGNVKNISERVLSVTELNLLGLSDTASYLQHRIKLAKGTDPEVLKRTAVVEIFRYAHGLPLEINLVADKAFSVAAEAKDKKVGPKHVKEAIKHISGIRQPLRVFTIAQYLTPVLIFLVLLLGGLQIKTFFDMKNIEEQYAGVKPLQEESSVETAEAETPEPAPVIEETAPESQPAVTAEAEPAKEEPPAVQAVEVPAEPAKPEIRYGCITARSGLKLRSRPSPNSEVVGVAAYNSRVPLLELKDDWWRSEVNGQEGYLFIKYVAETNSQGQCE